MCFEHQVCSTDIPHVGMPKDDISGIMALESGDCAKPSFA